MNIDHVNTYVVQQTSDNKWMVGRMTQFGIQLEPTVYYTESAAQRRCDFLNDAFKR